MSRTLSYMLPEHLAARRTASRRELGVLIGAVALAIACLAGAGFFMEPLNRIRRERQFVIDPATIRGLPPDIALLGKLGTFRALAIDWAAIRAERLKEEGKTYEAHELHKLVCRLAPRFPKVWVDAAWNMAYNISVLKYSPEERWQWVQNGIKILRDEGIQYNPKSVSLYKELAWIYWHKIRDFLDDHHFNYKRALAVEMERVLGPPPVTITDQEYFDWFQRIVDAPPDLDEMIRTDPDVARLVKRLSQVKLGPDDSLLDFVARNLRPELRVANLLKNLPEEDVLTARRIELITDPETAKTLERLLAAIRSKVLRERYKFDLEWMFDLMTVQYGPLDWRNASAHGLYWASLGDKITRDREGKDLADAMNTARIVFFALQSLVVSGRVTLWPDFDDPFSSYIEMTPDTRYIPYLYDTYMRLGKELFGDLPDFVEGTPGPKYMTGFVSSMRNWIELLWLEGGERNLELAENYYAWLRDNHPHPDGSTQEQYQKTIDEFVMGDILSQLATYKAASGLIRSLFKRALKQYSLGHKAAGRASVVRAKWCYKYWMQDTEVDFNERRKMQPFKLMFTDEMESFMNSPGVRPLSKAGLWKELPLEQRQMVFDRLRPYFERLCEVQKPPWDVHLAFGEPPGMEEFRENEIETRGAARRKDLEEGTRYKK